MASISLRHAALKAVMKQACHYEDREKMVCDLLKIAKPGDVLLFKGSRGMKMEQILESFMHRREK